MAKMQDRWKDQKCETVGVTFIFKATVVFGCGSEAEMLGTFLSKLAKVGGKLRVHDLSRAGLINNSFFCLGT